MDPRQQILLEQNATLRKENQTLRMEFRHLNATIAEKEATINQYRKNLASKQHDYIVLQEENASLQDIEEENRRLSDECRRLRRNHAQYFVHSEKPYIELNKHERTKFRQNLTTHFGQCLEAVDDWGTARITIQFSEDNQKLFWQKKYCNLEPDVQLPSEAGHDERWYPIQVSRIVHATDRFMISNQGYHEIQMNADKGLPSTHALKKRKNEMSTSIKIARSENPEMDAAYRSIKDVLMEAEVPQTDSRKVFIRFSCDGAMVARNRSAVIGSVKIFDCSQNGKPTEFKEYQLRDELPIFYLYGDEDEPTLRTEAAETFRELMEIKNTGLDLGGQHHEVELMMTCDWKCLCTMLGVNPPTCQYYCIMCDTTRDQRFRFSETDLGKWKINRGQAHREFCLRSADKRGYTHEPLLDINFEECPFDYLHLCKGVISRQFNQVVRWTLDQGNQSKLLAEMKRLKVPFDFYTVKGDDGKAGVLKWTNPAVNELRVIYQGMQLDSVLDPIIDKSKKAPENLHAWMLKEYCARYNLPTKGLKTDLIQRLKDELGTDIKLSELRKVNGQVEEIGPREAGGSVYINVDGLQALWRQGNKLLIDVRDGVDNVDLLQQELLQWGVDFMRRTIPEDISPYIHGFVFHAPEFVRKYGGLGLFQMEELERLHSVCKSAYFRKTHPGRGLMDSASMLMRYWNRILVARTQQYSRDKARPDFFCTKKRKRYNRNESSDENE